jgi:hypothetical protein
MVITKKIAGGALIATALSLGAFGTAAQAQNTRYPWCAVSAQDNVELADCTYSTFQQCLATISGLGGFCRENPRYVGGPMDDRPPPRGRR